MAGNVFGLNEVYDLQKDNATDLGLNIPGLGYGYVGAGEFPNVREVSKFDFTTEITTNLGDLFPAERAQLQGLSGPNFGYFGGMYGPPNTFFSTTKRSNSHLYVHFIFSASVLHVNFTTFDRIS